jgi:hypothetical protein
MNEVLHEMREHVFVKHAELYLDILQPQSITNI